MKINGFIFYLFLFLVCVVLTSISEPFRYLKYLLPVVPLLFYYNKRELNVNKRILSYYSSFIIFYSFVVAYLLLQNLIFSSVSSRFVPNAIFILGPLLFVILIIPFFNEDKIHQYVKMIFVINILVFVYEDWTDLLMLGFDLGTFRNALISSSISTENHLGFVFGFLVLFFFVEKYNMWYKLIAIVLLIMCLKRVVLVATAVSGISYFLLQFMRVDVSKHRKMLTWVAVSANLIFINVVYLMTTGKFDDFFLRVTGRSTNQFLMGRKSFFTEAFEKVGSIDWFGIGIGKIDEIITSFYGERMNLHSEILKNYFEFGVVLFVIWLSLLMSKTLFSNKAAVFVLYLNLLMLTDNVFIYFDVMFYFYFFILIFLFERKMNNMETVRAT